MIFLIRSTYMHIRELKQAVKATVGNKQLNFSIKRHHKQHSTYTRIRGFKQAGKAMAGNKQLNFS